MHNFFRSQCCLKAKYRREKITKKKGIRNKPDKIIEHTENNNSHGGRNDNMPL